VASAGTDPATIRCPVPWLVDKREIFFGACKKQMRREFRARFLSPGLAEAVPNDQLWLIGLYPPIGSRPRNVLFAGQVIRVMTFGRAYEAMVGSRYSRMRAGIGGISPLHLKPVYKGTELVGYEHRLHMHEAGRSWASDVAPKNSRKIEIEGRCVFARPNISAWDAFTLDATLMLRNTFWGPGHAVLELDDEAVDIFRRAQPTAGVTARNPLGTDRRGAADGKRGRYSPWTVSSRLIS
jgi:hypothetical protein